MDHTLARELVAIPSHEDPTAVGDRIEAWLREHTPAAVTRDDAGNLIARRGEGDGLALVGHHDVVPPDGRQTTEGGYRVERRDGRLYGRGAADMKAAVAAMCHAFRDADPAGELVLASFVGEEQGGLGCRAAIEGGFAPEFAVVGEGSTGYSGAGVTDVAVAHKGRRASELSALGESAHASVPEEGENAVYRACEGVAALRSYPAPTTEVRGERVAGSLAATGIEGGSAWNVVPDRCTVTVDERTVPGERADLRAFAERFDLEWTVEQDLPPMRCSREAFADAALAAATTAQDGHPEAVVKPHATDAGWLADAGTACVVCGPAEPGEAHTADESVSLAAVERCYRLYRTLAQRWPDAERI